MKKSIFFLVFCVSGCTNIPQESLTSQISLKDITNLIDCELFKTYTERVGEFSFLKRVVSTYNVTLKQENVVSLAPSLEYGLPLPPHASFGLTAGGSLTQTGTRTLTVKRTVRLAKLSEKSCAAAASSSPLASDLAILDPVTDALRGAGGASDLPDELGYRIDFVVAGDVTARPSWGLYRVSDLGATFKAGFERTNSVDIAFADGTPKGPLKVEVVQRQKPGLLSADKRSENSVTVTRGEARGGIDPDVRARLDQTIQRLQLETLLPRRR